MGPTYLHSQLALHFSSETSRVELDVPERRFASLTWTVDINLKQKDPRSPGTTDVEAFARAL